MSVTDTGATAVVPISSAITSKINWGEFIKVGAMIAATRGIDVPPDVQNNILMAIISIGAVYTFVMRTFFTAKITPSSAKGLAAACVLMLAVMLLLAPSAARAADVATKAPQSSLATMLTNGYPQQGGGFYYGIDTEAASSTLSGTPASAATIQGDLGFLIGYALNLSADGSNFVFVEGLFNISNLNAPGTSGLSASGPAHFEQRFAFGGPLTNFIGSFSTLSTLKNAVPTLPGLPAGITSGPQWPYLFASIHEQDVSVSYGLTTGKEWLIAPGFGVGMLSRLSNNVVMDVWAEAKLQSNSLTVGPAVSVKQGNGFNVGFALKY